MPANLPAEARARWLKVIEARTPQEKLDALREFLSAVPRHKGTEKLIMHARRQMAQLRREIEAGKRRKVRRGRTFFIEKEGAAQILLVGVPNCGKSTILRCLTGKELNAGEAPFETKKPAPFMVRWNGVYFQLVDTPSIVRGASRGALGGSKVLALARNADFLVLVVDGSSGVLDQLRLLEHELNEAGISIRKHALGNVDGYPDGISSLLQRGYTYKPSVVLVNKIDLVQDINSLIQEAENYLGGGIPIFTCSAIRCEPSSLDGIFRTVLSELDLIRIYTRRPGRKGVEPAPLVVRRGTRVIEVARMIHSRLYRNFKYAKVWSKRLRFSPQKVGRDFLLEDGDIVEIVA